MQISDQFDKIYELAEKSTVREEIKHPNRYISSGNKEEINWDLANLIYHRQTAETTRESVDGPSARSSVIKETTPMRCVGYSNRVWDDDDAFIPEVLARNVATKIGFSTSPALRSTLQMQRVMATVTQIQIDPETVWDDETDGIPYRVSSRFTLFAIDYDIELTGRQDCFALVTCN